MNKQLLFSWLFVISSYVYSDSSTDALNLSNLTKASAYSYATTSDPTSVLKLISWNVNLMNSWWLARMYLHYIDGQDMNDILLRAEEIAKHLSRKNYDVIALQEVADNASKNRIDEKLKPLGYFSSERLGERLEQIGYSPYLFNSGITLYSKHEFLDLEYHAFSRPASTQMLIPKGAVYGKINFYGRIVHLFSLHLQSIHSDTASEYAAQIQHQQDLKELLEKKQISSDEHVFIMGDFNIDSSHSYSTTEFKKLIQLLNAEEAANTTSNSLSASFDPYQNPMAKGKFPYGNLDNILCIKSRHCPYKGSMKVFRFEDEKTRLKELSDHYPVEAEIHLP